MSTLFNEQITYINTVQEGEITTDFSAVDTYTSLKMSLRNTTADLDVITDTNISVLRIGGAESYDQGFNVNTTGIFLVQYRISVSGGTADEYTMTMFVNDIEMDYTTITFSTKGTNIWEVQNLALLKLDYVELDNKGFGSSKNIITMKIKNISDTSSIMLDNGSFVIIKID